MGALSDFWNEIKGGLRGDIEFGGSGGTTGSLSVGQPQVPMWLIALVIIGLLVLVVRK